MSDTQVESEKPKNHVRVSASQSKFLYVNLCKHLLNDNEPFVELSGLGQAIAIVVDIVEILKNQGLVEVTKIETARGVAEARRQAADKISIFIKRSSDFAKIYAEQVAEKEARKAEKEANAEKSE